MSERVRLTLGQKIQLADYLRSVGQEAIDRENLGFSALARMASKKLKCEVTLSHVRDMMPEVGLKCTEANLEKRKNAFAKKDFSSKPEQTQVTHLLAQVLQEMKNLTGAVLLVADRLEQKAFEKKVEEYKKDAAEHGNYENPER